MNLRSVAPFRLFVRAAALCAGWLVCSFCIGAQSVPATNSDPSDLILVNGKIITVDARDSIAQAIAVHAGKIVAVGSNDEIRKRAPRAHASSTCTAAPPLPASSTPIATSTKPNLSTRSS